MSSFGRYAAVDSSKSFMSMLHQMFPRCWNINEDWLYCIIAKVSTNINTQIDLLLLCDAGEMESMASYRYPTDTHSFIPNQTKPHKLCSTIIVLYILLILLQLYVYAHTYILHILTQKFRHTKTTFDYHISISGSNRSGQHFTATHFGKFYRKILQKIGKKMLMSVDFQTLSNGDI